MTRPMTPGQRFLTAIANQVPDRVPVAPDTSNYIPCKRTGLPFWDIYLFEKIPLWQAYLDAVRELGSEAWMGSCTGLPLIYDDEHVTVTHRDVYRHDIDAMVRQSVIHTPDGELTSETTVMRDEPPSPTVKPIKDLQRDFRKWKWVCTQGIKGVDARALEAMRQACHRQQQAFGLHLGYPGFHMWSCYTEGGIEPLALASVDCPEILEEWLELDLQQGTRIFELAIAARPDYILFGGSGTITMSSPQLAMKYAIPALARWSDMCRRAGVATMLHSCGKSRVLVDMLVEHTSIQCINPLEIAPMGDCDLAEVKRVHGRHIALMGNLHTTQVMLQGTPQLVRQRALEAMAAAGEGGGFILSTGDQCGRETPLENLRTLVETAREFGVYDGAGRLPKVQEALGRCGTSAVS